jgi:uncharacterized protein YutD
LAVIDEYVGGFDIAVAHAHLPEVLESLVDVGDYFIEFLVVKGFFI